MLVHSFIAIYNCLSFEALDYMNPWPSTVEEIFARSYRLA